MTIDFEKDQEEVLDKTTNINKLADKIKEIMEQPETINRAFNNGGRISNNMIKLGAILEVKKFIKLRVPKNKSLSKAIGISEIKQYLQKKIQTDQLIEKISIKTRQYAKRQSTWARGHMKDWNKVHPVGLDKLLKKI